MRINVERIFAIPESNHPSTHQTTRANREIGDGILCAKLADFGTRPVYNMKEFGLFLKLITLNTQNIMSYKI